MEIEVRQGDCLELMARIPDGSIDMILCDLPYGTTVCQWDVVIPFHSLWQQYERIIKDNGAIVLTASQPFTSALIMSNIKLFRYELIWEKSKPSNFLDAKRKPLKAHENICVFYKKLPVYNPQKYTISEIFRDRRKVFNESVNNNTTYGFHGETKMRKKDDGSRNPISVIPIRSHWSAGMHPTQKPVELCEYLIKTYTNEGDTVLDNCMGSGTTGVACRRTNRKFIGFEKEDKYFQKAVERINLQLL